MSRFLQTRSVLYDGGCGMCIRMLRILHYLDVFRSVVPYDAANDWPAIQRKFPGISHDAAMRDMHVVTADGRIYRGFDAFRSMAVAMPMAWLILPLLYIPGIPWLGRRIYRRIADNRCTTSCRLQTGEHSARSV
jgi:predicted DCC family thiol-disulfide oxidoreductase YuxK